MINYIEYEMNDGTKENLFLGMKALFKIKSKNEEAFKTLNAALFGKNIPTDPLEIANLIHEVYTASIEKDIDLDTFYGQMNQDIPYNLRIFYKLIGLELGKKQDSAKLSNEQQNESATAE